MLQLLLVLAVDHVEMALIVIFVGFGRIGGESSGFSAVGARHVDYLLINLISKRLVMENNMGITQISSSFSFISISNKTKASSRKFSLGEGA